MTENLDPLGVTGAYVARVERVQSLDDTQLHTVPYGRFRLHERTTVPEREPRNWWNRLRRCWPAKEQLENGYKPPHPERYRHRRTPEIGFRFIGKEVGAYDGFTICWYAGLAHLGFADHFSVFCFDTSFDDAAVLKCEIEGRLPPRKKP